MTYLHNKKFFKYSDYLREKTSRKTLQEKITA